MERFEGKRVLLTGAGSGIGRATAVRLVREGASVVGLGRNEEALAGTATLVPDTGRFRWLPADLCEETAVVDAVAGAAELLGGLDVVVNVAGITEPMPADQLDLGHLRHVFATNTFGPMLVCREALPHLADGTGVIVNVSSTAATQAAPGMTAYSASKAALLAYSGSLAIELAPRRIRVVTISPGGVNTAMLQGEIKALDTNWYPRLAPPWGQVGEPEEIAATIAYAASADASYLNGTEIRLDGGARSTW
ncbi:SDR family oxidoreductase [Nocardioides sp. JQ2195]|uniref:SDR family NAD(P)-dependent oxidoreductase n=1 Tax=Nocardioides sp. JQ2195 TaxID=2592334 RepID=UPI00143E372A|nr:SDR family oxidoreductase [Nocardioides sp. JQ2195]QIX26545.1 SDR family oxidoreductase [Nocardioides sp. JQ2195]